MVSHFAQRRHYNSIVDGVDLEWYLLRLNEDISMARSKGILTQKKKELIFVQECTHCLYLNRLYFFVKEGFFAEQRKRSKKMCRSDLNVSICNTGATDVYIQTNKLSELSPFPPAIKTGRSLKETKTDIVVRLLTRLLITRKRETLPSILCCCILQRTKREGSDRNGSLSG